MEAMEVPDTISECNPSLPGINDDLQGLQKPSVSNQTKNVIEEEFDWTVNHLKGNCCACFSRILNSARKDYRNIKLLMMLFCGTFAGLVAMFILYFSYAFSLKVTGITGVVVAIAISVLLIFCYSSRCILSLVLPSLGTRQGKTILMAILAAQLLSGPMGNLTYNLKQTTNSLVCFSNMTANQTQQITKGIKDSIDNFTLQLLGNELGQVVDTVQGVQNIANEFSSIFSFGIQEKVEKYLGVDKIRKAVEDTKQTAKEAKRNLLSAKRNVSDEVDGHVKQFLDLTKFLKFAAILTLIYLLFSCWLYYFRFQHSVAFDNIYATHLLKRYDHFRIQRGGIALFPLRPRERRKIIDSMSLHMSPFERKALMISLAIYIGHCVITIFLYASDWTLYTFMKIIERNVNGSISWNETITFAIPKINFHMDLPINYDAQNCLAIPREIDKKTLIVIIILYIVLGLAIVSQAYCLRFRHAIAAFFYPDRNSERIQYLYNKLINHREKSKFSVRFRLIFHQAENAEISKFAKDSAGATKTRFISTARKFGMFKRKCLACGFPENVQFKNCSNTPACSSIFCPSCFDDMNNVCLVCTTQQG